MCPKRAPLLLGSPLCWLVCGNCRHMQVVSLVYVDCDAGCQAIEAKRSSTAILVLSKLIRRKVCCSVGGLDDWFAASVSAKLCSGCRVCCMAGDISSKSGVGIRACGLARSKLHQTVPTNLLQQQPQNLPVSGR